MSTHALRREAHQGDESLLVCDECGRRVVVAAGRRTIIDRGDEWAGHWWSSLPGLVLGVQVG